MTEAEWLACADPTPMLAFLRGKASDRKLRLFAVACCRRIWRLFLDERSRNGVEVLERYADGMATDSELVNVYEAHIDAHCTTANAEPRFGSAAYAADCALYIPQDGPSAAPTLHNAVETCKGAASAAANVAAVTTLPLDSIQRALRDVERAEQCRLLRDIFKPFRPWPPLRAAVLAWNDGTMRRRAEGIYHERAFDRLPVLADVLLDAGCENEDLIQHCRSAGPHVRGCWAVDLILGNE